MSSPWGLGIGAAIVMGALLGLPALILVPVIVLIVQGIWGRIDVTFLLVVAVCAGLGAGRATMEGEPAVPADLAESTGARLQVESLPRTSAAGDSVLVSTETLTFDSGSRPGDDLIVLAWLPEGERVAPGDSFDVGWSVDPLDVVDPGYGTYVESRGAVAVGRIWWLSDRSDGSAFYRRLIDLRHRVGDGLQKVLPGDAGALASGIVTGDDSGLSEAAREAFLRTGTTHITAVSGSNVAMLLAIWNLVIPAGRNRRLLVVQALIIVSIWMYAIVVGLESPALRAAIMASLILLAGRYGRRPDLLTLLALTSAGMVLWNPDHVRMVAFWLSVVATAAIIMRVPTAPGVGWKPLSRGVLEGVVLAQIATLPIVLWTFGTWSLTSVLANGLLSPLMWLAFPLCFVLAAIVVVVPWIAPIAALVPLIPLEISLSVVRILGAAMPPLDFHNAGLAGVVAVAVPCLAGLAFLGSDPKRWGGIVASQWRRRPVAVVALLIGPALGFLTALLLVLVRA